MRKKPPENKTKSKLSRYWEKLKYPSFYSNISDWCKDLRRDPSHLFWMENKVPRIQKIIAIENKFNCCWEDKFKEVFEGFQHGEGARILNLSYKTFFVWVRHLKLKRFCIYCNKKLGIRKGTFHPACKTRYESTRRSPGIQKLLFLIDPSINIEALDLKDENIRQVITDILSELSRQESVIIKNRYLYVDRKQTLQELGNIFKVTKERIRQIEKKAIKKLRHPAQQKTIKKKLIRRV